MNVTDDERGRAILIERARALAQAPAAPSAGEQLLVVELSVGEEDFSIDAAVVNEVVHLRHLTAVPGAPAAVRGVTTYRGEVLAAVDVRPVLGRPVGGLSDLPWLVVLGGEAPAFGLLAGRVSDVASIPVESLRPLSVDAPAAARRLARGVTDRAVTVLDGAALLAEAGIFAPADRRTDGSQR